jgi:hypothetical protein
MKYNIASTLWRLRSQDNDLGIELLESQTALGNISEDPKYFGSSGNKLQIYYCENKTKHGAIITNKNIHLSHDLGWRNQAFEHLDDLTTEQYDN